MLPYSLPVEIDLLLLSDLCTSDFFHLVALASTSRKLLIVLGTVGIHPVLTLAENATLGEMLA